MKPFMCSIKPFFLLFAWALFFSCKKEENNKETHFILGPDTKNTSVTLPEDFKLEGTDITFPKGTVLKRLENNPYTLAFELPEGVIMYDKAAKTSFTFPTGPTLPGSGGTDFSGSGTVSCTCTAGSGCSPFIADLKQKTVGCVMGNQCSTCTKTVKTKGVPIDSPDIVDTRVDMEFISREEDMVETTSPNLAFLNLPQVQEELRYYARAFYLGSPAVKEKVMTAKTAEALPEGYVIQAISIFGRSMYAPYPAERDPLLVAFGQYYYDPHDKRAGRGTIFSFPGATQPSCTCSGGGEGCSLKTQTIPFMGTITYCDAGTCKTCTLKK